MMPGVYESDPIESNLTDDVAAPVSALVDGLALSELVKNHNTEFEIRTDNGEDNEEVYKPPEACLSYEEVEKVVNLACIDADTSAEGDEGISPWDKFRRKMSNVTEDGKLMKYVVKQGCGPLVPDNSLVYVRYKCYKEFDEQPYDCTAWQQEGEDLPLPINLSRGNVLLGMHQALLTMCRGEQAEFLVHPDLAYGKFGCKPRIPEDATILITMEVDRFVDCGDMKEDDELSMEERREYKHVIKKAKGYYAYATDSFNKQNYSAAATKCRQMIDMLHNARLADEKEEKERNHYLMKSYTTACICYKKLQKYKLVCYMAADAMRVDRDEAWKKSKLQFSWGYAKMMLADYVGAAKHLKRAQKLVYPSKDQMIEEALTQLEKKIADDKQKEKVMAQRAFGFQSTGPKIRELDKDEVQLIDGITESLKNFKMSADNFLELKQTFTPEEEQVVQDVARGLGLHARVIDGQERRVIRVNKPQLQNRIYHPDL